MNVDMLMLPIQTSQPNHLPFPLFLIESLFIFCNIQEGEPAPEQNKRSPSDFLKAVLGRPVNVRLNSGTDYRGKQKNPNKYD